MEPCELPVGPVRLRPWRAADAGAWRPASRRVAEKAGFVLEGRLRRSCRYGDGGKDDELLWSLLSDDPVPPLSSRS